MKLKVTDKGVLIPKELLGDSQEVEITQQEDQIIVSIVNYSNMSIWDLGKNPVECDINNNVDINDKSCYNLAMELGIIGIAKDLPSDLSTNPDYFEGFGK
jgi:virulence-associated protein VagC